MRIVCFLVLLASTVCGNLLATGVKLPTNLQGTAVGQRVVDIYKGLVGRNIGFIVSDSGGDNFVCCTGTIEAVVLPDIRDIVTKTGGDFSSDDFMAASVAGELKLEMGSVQSEDQLVEEWGVRRLIETRNSDLNARGFRFANAKEVSSGILGEKIYLVRVIAQHRDGDSLIAEVLVEIEKAVGGDMYTEIEPFIKKLPMSTLWSSPFSPGDF